MCNLSLDKQVINKKYNTNFNKYFVEDLPLLTTFIDDTLLDNNINYIKVEQ